ncbi:beta-1,3-galactosyltransferase 2-like [Ylistrum balloti]|uniref:beta-1,3-galactosyltransferase 2-like n=1 Tax=Ylistrum balloti TaxID=509963 RepID=UPI002905B723|nr:beta-1,3-galactosyltransferase 2-like [Ylistrum balloti]
MSRPHAIMKPLWYVPISLIRKRSYFGVLYFLIIAMFGVLHWNIKTDQEKLLNDIYKAKSEVEALNEKERDVQSVLRTIHSWNTTRHQSLVLIDDRKYPLYARKRSSLDREGAKENTDRDNNVSILTNGSFGYNNMTKTHNKTASLKSLTFKHTDLYKVKSNAKKKQQELVNLLVSRLLQLANEGKKKSEKRYNEWLPFNASQYPQTINAKNLLQPSVDNEDIPTHPINKWKYTPVINPFAKCKSSRSGVFLLFIVKTKPENFVKRKTIRETWADELRFPNIRTVFSIGIPRDSNTIKQIKQEFLKYKDVLLMDYMDTYKNLTLKTTSGINWAVAHCNVAEFVVSVDDDMYVATDFLIQHLKDMPQAESERLYHGHLYHNTEPVRYGKKDAWESKWIVTREEYPFDTYPDYIFGGFVVMSMRTVLEMSLAIPYTQPISMEDVYLGIVASRLGIVATNTDLVDNYGTYSNVKKFKTLIASHYYPSAVLLRKAWEWHLSIVKNDIHKSEFSRYLKIELEQLKKKVDDILYWINITDNRGPYGRLAVG